MDDHFWGGGIALDLFLGGIGVGTFLLAVLVNLFYPEKFKQVSRIAAVATPISVGLGFLFLLVHLGHPMRIYVVFTKFRPTSPLWWGAWLQTAFFGISALYAWMWLKDKASDLRPILGYVGVPFALAVGVYHGFVLMVFKSKPLWNTGPVVVTAICGFILTGIAVVVLVLTLMPKQKVLVQELKVTRNVMGFAIAVQLLTLLLWLSSLYFGPGASHEAMLRLVGDYSGLFWGGAVVLGLLLPLAIGGIAIAQERKTDKFSYLVPGVTSLLVLVGGLTLRYVVIMAA